MSGALTPPIGSHFALRRALRGAGGVGGESIEEHTRVVDARGLVLVRRAMAALQTRRAWGVRAEGGEVRHERQRGHERGLFLL